MRYDHMFTMHADTKVFYDVTHYNTDCFTTTPGQHAIADMFFRLNTDQVRSSRRTLKVMDMLGKLGGNHMTLTVFLTYLFGKFFSFNAFLESTNSLFFYQMKTNDPVFVDNRNTSQQLRTRVDVRNLKLDIVSKVKIHILNSKLGWLFDSCASPKTKS